MESITMYYEIAGFHNETIFYYPWINKNPTQTTTMINSKLYLMEGTSVMMGAGSRYYDTFTNIFSYKTTFLLTLGKEKYDEDGTNVSTVLLRGERKPCQSFLPIAHNYTVPNTYQNWMDHLNPTQPRPP